MVGRAPVLLLHAATAYGVPMWEERSSAQGHDSPGRSLLVPARRRWAGHRPHADEVRVQIEGAARETGPEAMVTVIVEDLRALARSVGQVTDPGMFVMNPSSPCFRRSALQADRRHLLSSMTSASFEDRYSPEDAAIPLWPGRGRQVAGAEHRARERRRCRRSVRWNRDDDRRRNPARKDSWAGPPARQEPEPSHQLPKDRHARTREPGLRFDPLRKIEISATACEQNRVLLSDSQLRDFQGPMPRIDCCEAGSRTGRS